MEISFLEEAFLENCITFDSNIHIDMCGAVATENYSTLLMHITKYDTISVNVNVGHHGHPCYVRHELIDHRRRCTGNLVCECVGWFNSSMELC